MARIATWPSRSGPTTPRCSSGPKRYRRPLTAGPFARRCPCSARSPRRRDATASPPRPAPCRPLRPWARRSWLVCDGGRPWLPPAGGAPLRSAGRAAIAALRLASLAELPAPARAAARLGAGLAGAGPGQSLARRLASPLRRRLPPRPGARRRPQRRRSPRPPRQRSRSRRPLELPPPPELPERPLAPPPELPPLPPVEPPPFVLLPAQLARAARRIICTEEANSHRFAPTPHPRSGGCTRS